MRLGTGNIIFILFYVAFFVCFLLYSFFVFVENHIESEGKYDFSICFMCNCICFIVFLYLFRIFVVFA